MVRISLTLFLFLGLCLSAAAADEAKAPHPVFQPYESIRMALVNDTIEGVGDASKKLAMATQKLATTTEDAKARKSLETAGTTASKLAEISDLDTARKAFGDLSDSLIDYRHSLSGERPFVAYCGMAKKHWLQPEKTIGNPYYGQSMARCGEIVADSK